MKLAIADPPYPPSRAERFDLADGGMRVVTRSRAVRYYGGAPGAADNHPDAAVWDDPARHRQLLEELADSYDGWAIATSADGLEAYGPLPPSSHVMAWVRTNSPPSGHRIRSSWEPVIVYPPRSRRARIAGQVVTDVLLAASPRIGFTGAKPPEWTRWVLAALGYDQEADTVDDLFHGSGSVADAVAQGVLL